jgi:hypothetical protein
MPHLRDLAAATLVPRGIRENESIETRERCGLVPIQSSNFRDTSTAEDADGAPDERPHALAHALQYGLDERTTLMTMPWSWIAAAALFGCRRALSKRATTFDEKQMELEPR